MSIFVAEPNCFVASHYFAFIGILTGLPRLPIGRWIGLGEGLGREWEGYRVTVTNCWFWESVGYVSEIRPYIEYNEKISIHVFTHSHHRSLSIIILDQYSTALVKGPALTNAPPVVS